MVRLFYNRVLSVFFLFYLSIHSIFGSNVFNDFLIAFKNLEYQKAEKLITQLDNQELATVCLGLIKIQKNRSQNLEFLSLKVEDKNYQGITKVISYLQKGYYSLYENPYKSDSYISFQQAYRLSKEEFNNPELTKICLLAILDVYSKGLSKVDEDCLGYLKILKESITDFSDEYYYNLHYLKMFFRGESSGQLPDIKFIEGFTTLMKNFDESHLFFADYYYCTGIFKRFTGQKKEAIQFYKKAIEISKKDLFLQGIQFSSLAHLADTNRELGNLKLTKFYLLEAEKKLVS